MAKLMEDVMKKIQDKDRDDIKAELRYRIEEILSNWDLERIDQSVIVDKLMAEIERVATWLN